MLDTSLSQFEVTKANKKNVWENGMLFTVNEELSSFRKLGMASFLFVALLIGSCICCTECWTASPFCYGKSGSDLRAMKISASEMDEQLSSDEERVTVSVVRNSGPSVAFVSSSLGSSGSGFVVEKGYIVTNYHVIEDVYELQNVLKNPRLPRLYCGTFDNTRAPELTVRINSRSNKQPCRIVDVRQNLDIAVLKIVNETTTSNELSPLSFGDSTELLVGQSLIAIGNPFGLDNTVTKGVVSALDRELPTGRRRSRRRLQQQVIRNCIQTDCSINPGNSGGPLLNLKGEVVGVNTAILSTSGSSAGIGLAVPSSLVEPAVAQIIRNDNNATRALLGVDILRENPQDKNWVAHVRPGSPASQEGIRGMSLDKKNATVTYGDAIVNIGGRDVTNFQQLQEDLDQRRPGEQIMVTLENRQAERRVIYVTL